MIRGQQSTVVYYDEVTTSDQLRVAFAALELARRQQLRRRLVAAQPPALELQRRLAVQRELALLPPIGGASCGAK